MSNKQPRRQAKTPTWKKVLLWTGVILLVLILAPVVAFFSAYAVTKVPEPQELQTNQIATMYASDSSTQLCDKPCWPRRTVLSIPILASPLKVSDALRWGL